MIKTPSTKVRNVDKLRMILVALILKEIQLQLKGSKAESLESRQKTK